MRAHKPMIMATRGGLPAGTFAWSLRPRSPRQPAIFSVDPDQGLLGNALSARITEATRLTAEAAVAAGLLELASQRLAKPIHDLHNLMSRAVARFLITGQGTTETERSFIGRVGVIGARYGLSVATLTRSYLLWRDTNLRILDEEVDRLGIGQPASSMARKIISSSADSGILRMARAYDSQTDELVTSPLAGKVA
ncbi:MAG TPA: hypothetical protein VIJ58_09480 [Candidatus Dormibacteraeota bacterium]